MPAKRLIKLLLCSSFVAATAPASAEEGNVSLQATMCALFQSSPAFQVYGAQTRIAEARHLRTSGAFDVVATAALQGQRTLWPSATGYGNLSDQGFNDLSLQAALGTRLRENITIQLNGAMPLISSIDSLRSFDQPVVGANLTIPLLKLGRSTAFGAEERAAGLHSAAAAALQQDAESELATRVAEAYWHWVGSYEQLKWARRLEALALDQVKDVDQLIAQHARAAVDRLAFAAAAENATASRVQAEQVLFDQQQLVWETIGLPPPNASVLPESELPSVPATIPVGEVVARRAHELAQARPLFKSLNDEVEGARVRVEAARIGKRPDLNLVGQGTATRVERSDSLANVSASSTASVQTQLGYYGSIALQFSLPLQNRTARGAFEEAAATRAELELTVAQRRNAIEVRIDALSSALTNLTRSYQERTRAVEQFELSFHAERTKFRLGTATAMDVVVAEQQYMSASLGTVADRTAFAVILARLLHEAGVLNPAVHSRDSVAVARSLTSPTF
jgi:outer membrane protein